MSLTTTALDSVSVTTAPDIDGVPLRLTVCSLPAAGFFFTVNAPFARPAAPSASSR